MNNLEGAFLCSDESLEDVLNEIFNELCDSIPEGEQISIQSLNAQLGLRGFIDYKKDESEQASAYASYVLDGCGKILNKEINDCEKAIIADSPIDAYRAYRNSMLAEKFTFERFNRNSGNDCSDAFRHAIWQAMNASSTGSEFAQSYADAHECGSEGTQAFEMDNFNNSKGITIGTNFNNVPFEVLADRVCDALEAGQLKIFEDLDNSNSPLINSHGCECN